MENQEKFKQYLWDIISAGIQVWFNKLNILHLGAIS